jgi:flagellar assembly factor FliW
MLITQVRPRGSKAKTTTPQTPSGDSLSAGDVLDFASGIPGFPNARQFELEGLAPELEPFCLMRSVEAPELSFVLVPPGALFPDYSVEIDEQHVTNLGLDSAEDAAVMVVVTLGEPPTANLLGPVVVNRRTRAAAQVVQYQAGYRAAEPLTPRSGA